MSIRSSSARFIRRGILAIGIGVVGALTLAQCGCATSWPEWWNNGWKVGPNYKKPPAPVPHQWIEANDPRVGHGNPNLASWWTVFDDPALNRLVDIAYHRNYSLRALAYQVEAARSQLALAVGELLPQAQTLTGSYTRREISLNGGGGGTGIGTVVGTTGAAGNTTGGAGAGTSTGTAGTNTGTSVNQGLGGGFSRFSSTWATSLNLSWELDFWGKFRRAVESADASLDRSIENYDEALVILMASVATQYVEYRTLQRRLELARINVSQQEPLVAMVEKRLKEQATDAIPNYYQLKANLEATKALIPQLEALLAAANNQICLLLGMPVRDLGPELGDGKIPSLSNPKESFVKIPHPIQESVVLGIPAQMLLRRPDVLAAERAARAQSAQIGIAESEWYPHILINGSIGLSANRFSKLFDQKSWTGSIGPSLSWNILNYGRILANVRFENATFQQLVATYQNTVLVANQETEDALAAYLNELVRSNNLTESAFAARKVSDYLRKQFESGFLPKSQDTSTFINRLFTALNFTVTQEDIAAQSQGNVALDLIQVYKALGGGWQIRLKDIGPDGRCQPQRPDDGGFPTVAPQAGPQPMPIEALPVPQPAPAQPKTMQKAAATPSPIPAAILGEPAALIGNGPAQPPRTE